MSRAEKWTVASIVAMNLGMILWVGAFPQAAVLQNPLNHVGLIPFDETDDLRRATALGAFQQIDFVDALDEDGPNAFGAGKSGRGYSLARALD